MSGPGLLFFRPEGGATAGTGHAMRCLALGQAWVRSGGEAVFAVNRELSGLAPRLKAEGMDVVFMDGRAGSPRDAAATARAAVRAGSAWLVTDGYGFGARYQAAIKDAGLRLLAIDDFGALPRYAADAVLNQNLFARPSLYSRAAPRSHLLLGARYLLLRREFQPWRSRKKRIAARARRLLVALGGGDPSGVAPRLLPMLGPLSREGWKVTVLAGVHHPWRRQRPSFFAGRSPSCHLEIDPPSVAPWMAWADVAVTAGGTTAWECAYMGLPSLFISVADNQRAVVRSLVGRGIGMDLGWHADVDASRALRTLRTLAADPAARRNFSRRGRLCFDGGGAGRVVDFLQGQGPAVRLRPAAREDRRRVWAWSNDPSTRAQSLVRDPIPWADHVRWFERTMKSPGGRFWIGCDVRGTPVGQVRLSAEAGASVISVSVDGRARSRGWGSAMIREAARLFFQTAPRKKLDAYIRPGNTGSERAFEKAGFRVAGSALRKGQRVRRWVCRKGWMS